MKKILTTLFIIFIGMHNALGAGGANAALGTTTSNPVFSGNFGSNAVASDGLCSCNPALDPCVLNPYECYDKDKKWTALVQYKNTYLVIGKSHCVSAATGIKCQWAVNLAPKPENYETESGFVSAYNDWLDGQFPANASKNSMPRGSVCQEGFYYDEETPCASGTQQAGQESQSTLKCCVECPEPATGETATSPIDAIGEEQCYLTPSVKEEGDCSDGYVYNGKCYESHTDNNGEYILVEECPGNGNKTKENSSPL